MKVLMFYFSATGNTKKIADLYSASFESAGHETELADITDADISAYDLEKYDLIGVGYPIHSFNAPRNVLKFCKSFPKRDGKKDGAKRIFVFKSSGEPVRMSDVSSLRMRNIFKRRGYAVTNEYQYVMPYNIIFRHSDENAYRMWETAKSLAPVDVKEILRGEGSLPRGMFMGRLLAWFCRIEHPGARINGKFFRTNKNCVNCGMCVKACPTHNIIDKNGKIKFGGKCLMCMRCSFNCPKNAIEIGLFKSWKVNGAYSFQKPTEASQPQDKKHAKYCKKAYDRYYKNAEARIANDEKLAENTEAANE